MRLRAFPLMIAIALTASAPAPAPAQQTDSVAAAQEHFKKGRDAYKKGDFSSARASFQKSQELSPTPGTLLNLALCEEQLGMTATAWQHFIDLTGQLSPTDERQALAKQHATALEPRVPYLRIELEAGAPAGTRVTRDKLPVAGTNLGSELPVDPGKHEIVVTAPGRKERVYEVILAQGKRETIKVEPGPEQPVGPVATGAPSSSAIPTTTASAPPPSGGMRTAGFVIGGVGVAGLALGGVTGVLTILKTNEVEGLCPVPSQCTDEGVAVADSARTLGLVSTIGFIAGAACVGVGALLVITGKPAPQKETAAVGATVLPGGGGLTVLGTF